MASWSLVSQHAPIQGLRGEQDPDAGQLPVHGQRVQTRFKRLPQVQHQAVVQLGHLVQALDSSFEDLGAGYGFGDYFPGSCEDHRPAVGLGTRSFLVRSWVWSRVQSWVRFGPHPAKSKPEKVTDLAAVFDPDLRSVFGQTGERTEARLLLRTRQRVLLHLFWTEVNYTELS